MGSRSMNIATVRSEAGGHTAGLAVDDAVFSLWQRLDAFPPARIDAALRVVQEWLADAVGADNVVWVGAVRLRDKAAQKDATSGWRQRARIPLRADPERYVRAMQGFANSYHYGRLTTGYYERPPQALTDAHVSMPMLASIAKAGRFRVTRLSDPDFIDYAAFKRTQSYRIYYRGIFADNMTVCFPLHEHAESAFSMQCYVRASGGRGKRFTARDAAVASTALRGVPRLHRHLMLSHGLMMGEKKLSPVERQVLSGLLGGCSEKEIARDLGLTRATVHSYVSVLQTHFGVRSRAALMAMWN